MFPTPWILRGKLHGCCCRIPPYLLTLKIPHRKQASGASGKLHTIAKHTINPIQTRKQASGASGRKTYAFPSVYSFPHACPDGTGRGIGSRQLLPNYCPIACQLPHPPTRRNKGRTSYPIRPSLLCSPPLPYSIGCNAPPPSIRIIVGD